MKLKKLVACGLAALLSTAMLAGCTIPNVNLGELGQGGNELDPFGNVNSHSNGGSEDPNTGALAGNPEDQVSTEVSDDDFIFYSTYNYSTCEWSDDYEFILAKAGDVIVTVDENEVPNLYRTLEAKNQTVESQVNADLEELAESAKEQYNELVEYGEVDFFGTHESTSTAFVRRADKKILCVGKFYVSYMGGAHPWYSYSSDTYNTQTGEEMSALDFVEDTDKFLTVLSKRLGEEYPDLSFVGAAGVENADEVNAYFKENYVDGEYEFAFYADYDGLTIIFNPYEIASFAEGVQMIKLKYTDYPDVLKKEFFANPPKDYVIELDATWGYVGDVNNDGVDDHLGFTYDYTEYDEIESIGVCLNDNYVTSGYSYVFSAEPILVHVNDKTYIYFKCGEANDYTVTHVFDVSCEDGLPRYVDCFGGYYDCIKNPHCFDLEDRLYILSTWGGVRKYEIGPDGMPSPIEMDYRSFSDSFGLTLKQDLPNCELVDKDTYEVQGEITLKQDDMIYFYRSDGQNYVVFRTSDGKYVRLYVSQYDGEDQWGYAVNGIFEQDLFDGQLYAG